MWALLCSLYGPCSSVTTCTSSCTPASGFSWERTSSFGGDTRVKHHLPSQASQHAYKQEGRFCCSCVWAFCFSWGREGALAFSDCSRKAESAYRLCPPGLSFHSAPFSTQRSSSFNSPFAHSRSLNVSSALFSQPPALAVITQLRLRVLIFKKKVHF